MDRTPGERWLQSLPLALLAVFLVWCGWHVGRTIFEPLHVYGDSGAEAALLMGLRNFHRYGFIGTHFLPIHNSGPTIPLELIVQWTYDRYPPGPDWIASVVSVFAAEDAFWAYRLLPLLLNLGAIYLFFRLTQALIGDAWLALFVALTYAMNLVFFRLADSFYYTGYAEFLRMFMLWSTFRLMSAPDGTAEQRNWRTITIVCGFVGVWITFDYVPANLLGPFLLVVAFAPGGSGLKSRMFHALRIVVPLGIASMLAMTLRLVQNGWARGSIWQALHDFYLALMYRIFNQTPGAEWYTQPVDKGRVIAHVIDHTAEALHLQWRIVFLAMAAVAIVALLTRLSRPLPRYFLLLLVMAPTNACYLLLLPAWTQEHFVTYGIRHVLPTYALIVGGGLAIALTFALTSIAGAATAMTGLRQRIDSRKTAIVTGAGRHLTVTVLCGFVCYAFSPVLVVNARDTLRLWRSSPAQSWSDRFAHIDALRQHVPRYAMMFGNAHWFRPEARYRFDRMTHGTWGLQELREEPFWLPPGANEERIPWLPAGVYEGYFVFYNRWDEPNDHFFPNFGTQEAELSARTHRLSDWLHANAEFIVSSGKWSLYRLTRLPTAAEASASTPSGRTE